MKIQSNEINIEEIKQIEGLENITDEEALSIIEQIKTFSLIAVHQVMREMEIEINETKLAA